MSDSADAPSDSSRVWTVPALADADVCAVRGMLVTPSSWRDRGAAQSALVRRLRLQADQSGEAVAVVMDLLALAPLLEAASAKHVVGVLGLHRFGSVVAEHLAEVVPQSVPTEASEEWAFVRRDLLLVMDKQQALALPVLRALVRCPRWCWSVEDTAGVIAAATETAWGEDAAAREQLLDIGIDCLQSAAHPATAHPATEANTRALARALRAFVGIGTTGVHAQFLFGRVLGSRAVLDALALAPSREFDVVSLLAAGIVQRRAPGQQRPAAPELARLLRALRGSVQSSFACNVVAAYADDQSALCVLVPEMLAELPQHGCAVLAQLAAVSPASVAALTLARIAEERAPLLKDGRKHLLLVEAFVADVAEDTLAATVTVGDTVAETVPDADVLLSALSRIARAMPAWSLASARRLLLAGGGDVDLAGGDADLAEVNLAEVNLAAVFVFLQYQYEAGLRLRLPKDVRELVLKTVHTGLQRGNCDGVAACRVLQRLHRELSPAERLRVFVQDVAPLAARLGVVDASRLSALARGASSVRGRVRLDRLAAARCGQALWSCFVLFSMDVGSRRLPLLRCDWETGSGGGQSGSGHAFVGECCNAHFAAFEAERAAAKDVSKDDEADLAALVRVYARMGPHTVTRKRARSEPDSARLSSMSPPSPKLPPSPSRALCPLVVGSCV